MADRISYYNRVNTNGMSELDLDPPRTRIAVAVCLQLIDLANW